MMTFHRIKITDRDDAIIYDGLIYKLPLKEKAVQRKCTEVYKEPCRCNRRAEIIKGVLYIILDDYFTQYVGKDTVQIMQISDKILDILDLTQITFGK